MSRQLTIYDLSTIIGISNNPSPWALWNILKDKIPESPLESARGDWNRRMRPAILEGIQDRYNCKLDPLGPVHEPDSIISVSGAMQITKPGDLPLTEVTNLFLLRQIPTDAFAFQWSGSEGVRAPLAEVARAHIFMMAHAQPRCAIFLLVGAGEKEHIVEVAYDQVFAQEVIDKIHAFKWSLEANIEPDPDYAIDGKALELRYKPIDENPLDLRDQKSVFDIVKEYEIASAARTDLNRQVKKIGIVYDEAKARLKGIMGEHKTAKISENISVTCSERTVGPSERDGYSYQVYNINNTATQ